MGFVVLAAVPSSRSVDFVGTLELDWQHKTQSQSGTVKVILVPD